VWFDIIAALGLTLSTAHAADPVLYTGDAETALARIASTTETPSDYLRPVSVEAILAEGPAFAYGEATVVPCEGRPLDAAGLRAEAERLYAAILMGLVAQRADVARRAPMRLACLDSPPDVAQAARLLSLAGVVDQLAGDEGAAEQAHLAARAFDPKVTWNPEWPPEARVSFDRAMVVALVEDPVPLEWRPVDATVLVDGQEVPPGEVEVVPGLHLIQWGDPIRCCRPSSRPNRCWTGPGKISDPSSTTHWANCPAPTSSPKAGCTPGTRGSGRASGPGPGAAQAHPGPARGIRRRCRHVARGARCHGPQWLPRGPARSSSRRERPRATRADVDHRQPFLGTRAGVRAAPTAHEPALAR